MQTFPTISPIRRLSRFGLLAGLGLSLAACASTTPSASAKPRHAVATPSPKPGSEEHAKFQTFIRDFRKDALKAGIRPAIYDRSMRDISLNSHIQDLNNKQPEFVRPIWEYLDGAVSPLRVKTGHEKLEAHLSTLANLEQRFGVPKEILVAIWGIESNYGTLMGHYNMFEALATLGYDGRRADFGRSELIAAMKMEQKEDYRPKDMLSSWAGAFGQTQFMPSTFLTTAVDGDGDGHIDLWNSVADALASTAALLDKAGWRRGEPWGYEVRLPRNFPYAEAEIDNDKPLSHWRALGVKTATGGALPPGPDDGAIFVPAGADGPAFLVFHNFKMILRYNNATSYALAVGELAHRIGGGGAIVQSWPRGEEPLSRDERFAFQRDLKQLGYDPGGIDGIIGKNVRGALRDYQRAHGLTPDGFATKALLKRMERDIASRGN